MASTTTSVSSISNNSTELKPFIRPTLTKPQLQAELHALSLPTDGFKPILQARLQIAYLTAANPNNFSGLDTGRVEAAVAKFFTQTKDILAAECQTLNLSNSGTVLNMRARLVQAALEKERTSNSTVLDQEHTTPERGAEAVTFNNTSNLVKDPSLTKQKTPPRLRVQIPTPSRDEIINLYKSAPSSPASDSGTTSSNESFVALSISSSCSSPPFRSTPHHHHHRHSASHGSLKKSNIAPDVKSKKAYPHSHPHNHNDHQYQQHHHHHHQSQKQNQIHTSQVVKDFLENQEQHHLTELAVHDSLQKLLADIPVAKDELPSYEFESLAKVVKAHLIGMLTVL